MKLIDQTSKLVELGFIYALTDPTTDEIFYIGATEQAPRDRLKGHYAHFQEYLEGKRNKTKKFEYFEKVWPKLVNIKLLEIVQNDYLYKKEIEYIEKYSKLYNLTNQTLGGDGGDTFSLQEFVNKSRISSLISQKNTGRVMSNEQKQFLSESRIGSNNPMAGININYNLVAFKDGKPLRLCRHPFEITEFLDDMLGKENHKIHSGRSGNMGKAYRKGQREIRSSGFVFKRLEDLSPEIQDIVLREYENIHK